MISRLAANPVIEKLPTLMATVPTQETMSPNQDYLVLDTNIVLDLFYWRDARVQGLMQALSSKTLYALVSLETLAELTDVLMRAPFDRSEDQTRDILTAYLALSCQVSDTDRASRVRCKDVDDQKFLDLAAKRVCPLITRDKHLLKIAKKMRRLGVRITTPEGL